MTNTVPYDLVIFDCDRWRILLCTAYEEQPHAP